MIVLSRWPDCRFYNDDWQDIPKESFWIEVKQAELSNLLVHAKDEKELLEETIADYMEDEKFYLLVTRDLSSIISLPSYYPVSGQWNGYSPFEAVEPFEITDLQQLSEMEI